MTVAEIRALVRDRLDESSVADRYTDADLLDYINQASRHFASRLGLRHATTTITQAPYILFYDLPSDCITVRAAYRAGSAPRHLTPTTVYALDSRMGVDSNYRWPRQGADRSDRYDVFGLNEIMLWPVVATAGETYTVNYVQDLGDSDVSASTDTPTIPAEFHEALADYACARALLAEGATEDAEMYVENFLLVMEDARQKMNNAERDWSPDPYYGMIR